jgi:hypothetical protein
LSPLEHDDITLVQERLAQHRLQTVDVLADDYLHQLTAALRHALGPATSEKKSEEVAQLLQMYQSTPW